MTWLSPAAAWWLLLVPALLALYMLRARPVRKTASSLRLWEKLPHVARPKAKLRRPPLSLLLLMQAILLLAGAIALTRPALTAPAGRQLVLLLDASGSMGATDGGSTRFERAKEGVRRIVSAMAQEDDATLLRVGPDVVTLCSLCNQLDVGRALERAMPGAGRADMRSALSVATGLARRAPQGSVETFVISDGAYEPLPEDVLPPTVSFVGVGSPADNLAITVLSARRPPDGRPGYSAYARLENKGWSQRVVEVAALADTVPQPSRNLTLPPGGQADLIWQLPAGTVRFTVNVRSQDALAADNQALLVLPQEGQHKVAIISDDRALYERALAGLPGLAPASGQEAAGAGFTIIEGQLPDPLPSGNLLLVNPTGNLLPASGEMEDVRPLGGSAHPLLSGVDIVPTMVQKAKQLDPLPWLDPVVQSSEGPLLLTGERESQRIVVLTFDPNDSNLPKLAAFPLLMANVVDWLYPLAGVGALGPGDTIRLPPGSTVAMPGGRGLRVGDEGIFSDTEETGLYRVTSNSLPEFVFSVNMVDAQESDLTPQPHPELDRPTEGRMAELETRQEVWTPLAALALALLGAEWLLYCWKRGQV